MPTWIVPLGVLAAIAGISYFANRRVAGQFQRLSTVLKGRVRFSFFGPSYAGRYQGHEVCLRWRHPTRQTPAYLYLEMSKPASFMLTIAREGFWTRLGKQVGVVQEVTIQDPLFDEAFYIRSSHAGQARSYLQHADHRQTIEKLFSERGADLFMIQPHGVVVRKPRSQGTMITPDEVIQDLEWLERLANGY